ncbi:MAG: hypothetical protein R3F11_08540 [Verrucomicrobiales bacterium]
MIRRPRATSGTSAQAYPDEKFGDHIVATWAAERLAEDGSEPFFLLSGSTAYTLCSRADCPLRPVSARRYQPYPRRRWTTARICPARRSR